MGMDYGPSCLRFSLSLENMYLSFCGNKCGSISDTVLLFAVRKKLS